MSAASITCEAAEIADYHTSTAHLSSYANDCFTDCAIEEAEADYECTVRERAADSAQWQEFAITSDESKCFSDD